MNSLGVSLIFSISVTTLIALSDLRDCLSCQMPCLVFISQHLIEKYVVSCRTECWSRVRRQQPRDQIWISPGRHRTIGLLSPVSFQVIWERDSSHPRLDRHTSKAVLLFLLSGFKCDCSRFIHPSYMNPSHGLQAVWPPAANQHIYCPEC